MKKSKSKSKRVRAIFLALTVMLLVGLPVRGATYIESPKVDAKGNMLPLDKGFPLNLLPNVTAGTYPLYQTTAARGLASYVYVAIRTDGRDGLGTEEDPRDGSSAAKMDALLLAIPAGNVVIHLGKGTFQVTPGNATVTGSLIKSGWTIEGEGEGTVIQLSGSLATWHFGVWTLSSASNASTDGVTLRNFMVDGNWPGIGSTADEGLGGGTVTDGVTSNGYYGIKSASSKFDKSYIGRTITGTGIPANNRILRIPTTAVTAASDGATLPQSTINVGSAVDFFVPGTFFVSNAVGFQQLTCSGKTLTTLTGCSGGTGTISTGQLVSTTTQLVFGGGGNATADGTNVSITFGGQKQIAVGGIFLYGSNNTVENVHTKNLYGSTANSKESFAIVLSSPTGGPPGRNNHIRNVVCDTFYGDYWSGVSIVGINSRLPARDSSIENYTVIGNEWPFLRGGAHAGGVAYAENCTVSGGKLRFAGVAIYVDTGSLKNCLFTDIQSYGMSGGIWLIANANADFLFNDVTFYNCQFDIMNMELLSGDADNAVRITATATTNLKIEHCRFMQRSGGMGQLSGHAVYLQNATNPKLFYNQFDTDGVVAEDYYYKGINSTGVQLFYNRDRNGGLLTRYDGLLDNVSYGASDINVSGVATAGNFNTTGTYLGNASLLTQIQAKNIEATSRVVNDADYVIKDDDYLVGVATLTHPITIALPSASQNKGKFKYIKDMSGNAGTQTITITPNVEGATKTINANYGRIGFRSDSTDGTTWTWWVQ